MSLSKLSRYADRIDGPTALDLIPDGEAQCRFCGDWCYWVHDSDGLGFFYSYREDEPDVCGSFENRQGIHRP